MTMFKRLSINNKLALVLGGTVLLTFTVASAALMLFEHHTLEHRVRQIMEPYAQLISVGAEAAVAFEDPERAQEILNTLHVIPQIQEAEIVLRDGSLLAGYSSRPNTTPRILRLRPDGVYMNHNNAELMMGLQEGAHLHLVMSLDELRHQNRNVLLLFAAGLLVLLAATTLGLRAALQHTIVQPISTLAETVEQVRTQADYHQRVPTSGADEVSQLARSFNAMMGVIQERENELRRSEKHKAIQNKIANIFLTIPDEEMYGEVLAVVLSALESKFGVFGFIEVNGDLVMPSMTREIWNECQILGKSIIFPAATWGESLLGRAIREKRTFLSDGPFHTPEGHIHIDHYLTVPIIFGNRAIGLIAVANNEQGYAEEDKSLLEIIADYISPILNARLQRDRQELERKQTEHALRESEEKFSAAFHASPNLIIITRLASGTLLDVNDSYSRMLGYSRTESIGKTTIELSIWADPADRATFVARLEEVGQVIDFETTFRCKDGKLITVIDSARTINLHGETCILSIAHDITERMLAEREHVANLKFFESMDRVNRAIQGTSDLQRMMSDVLEAVLSIFGCDRVWLFYPCDPEAASFRVPMEITRPEYPGAMILNVDIPMPSDMARNLQEALESPGPVTYNIGTERPINKVSAEQFSVKSMMMVALYPKSGKPWVFGLHQCSAPRVWTPDEVKLLKEIGRRLTDALSSLLSHRGLQESEANYRRIVDTSAEGIWVLGPDSKTTFVNARMTEMLGYSGEEMISRPVTDFIFEEDTPDYLNKMERRCQGLSENYERRFRRKDGRILWTQVSATPVFDDTHSFQGSLAMLTDITERKRAEEEKEKLKVQLAQAQKMESVGRLAGGVAHDFNNMLGVILGHTELAMGKVGPAHPLFAALQEIQEAAKRSANLTRQLLAFARKQTIAPRVLDLNETVEGMLKMLERLIGEDIDLAWLPSKNLWPVKLDPSQIDQILANLCVNARDAIAGVGKVTIETKNAVFDDAYCSNHKGFNPGNFVLLAVSDNGHGMDTNTLDKIFEPFFTTKEIGLGTGLGLSTVYGTVKQNNGFINVYSEPGHGTTFNIYLPRYAARTEQMRKESPDALIVQGHETILLVEDESAILNMTRLMLESFGYRVLPTSTPGEAIRAAKEQTSKIHLLISDVVMPQMNGRDLAKKLISLYPELKCLFMSGYTSNVIAHHGVLDEGINFIQKPFSIQALAAKVREALDGK
jgi:PAS domain S-box-containing protein